LSEPSGIRGRAVIAPDEAEIEALATQALRHRPEPASLAEQARARHAGTNTKVLDAETARVQSYDNDSNAAYDAIVAGFELRRAVGDL
jgi:hypothetical protein